MARASYFVRFCAVAAMLHFSGDVAQAAPLFETYCPNHGLKEGVNEFLRRWWDRYETCPKGECFLYDPPRCGRPAKVTKADAKTAAVEFDKGHWTNGKKKPFTSLQQVRSRWAPGRAARAAPPPPP